MAMASLITAFALLGLCFGATTAAEGAAKFAFYHAAGSLVTCPPTGLHFVEHPDDCSLYYVCVNGEVARIEQCPRGMLFSPELKKCDREDSVVCGGGPTPPPPTTPEADPVTSSTVDPGLYPCPFPDIEFIYMPHPIKCNMFYWCEYGVFGGISNCGVNLWFGFTMQACVPPHESGCDKEELPTTEFPQNIPI